MIGLPFMLVVMRRGHRVHGHPADRIDHTAARFTAAVVMPRMSARAAAELSSVVGVTFMAMAVAAVLRFHFAPSESHMVPWKWGFQ